MRRFTRLALAALAAIGASGALVAAPAASWVNFGGGITNVDGTTTHYGSTVNTATVTGGTWNAEGGYLQLGDSTTPTDGSITLQLPATITSATAVTVMLDVEGLPTGAASLITVALSGSKPSACLETTSTGLQQVTDGVTYGSCTYDPASRSPRQMIAFTYNSGVGTNTIIDGVQRITNTSLKYSNQTPTSVTIGAVQGLKVYGIYLYASQLSAGEVSNEIAAARAEIVPDVSVSMTRNGAADDNTIKVATLRKGATISVTDFEATFGTSVANAKAARNSANTSETGTFFKGSWSSCVNTNVKSGYPMVCNKFLYANSDYYWRLWVPITLESTDVFNEVLPELYPTTSGGEDQGAAATFFNYTISLYEGTVFEGTKAVPIATATGTTSSTLGLNTARATLDNAISGRSGVHTLKIEVKPNTCGGGTYSGIRSVQFFNRTTASRAVSGDAGTWSTGWTGDVAPIMGTDVTLTVSDAASLAMDTAATLSSLTVNDGSDNGSAALTFSGAQSLSSLATTLNVSTDVSAITANLGAVTLASGKTLTMRDLVFSSITSDGGALCFKGGTVSSALLQTFNGAMTLRDGADVTLPNQYTMTSKQRFIADSGNATLKLYNNNAADGVVDLEGDETIQVKAGATLTLKARDLGGWNGYKGANLVVAVRGERAKITADSYEGQPGCFAGRVVLADGGEIAGGSTANASLNFYGDTSTNADYPEIYVSSGTGTWSGNLWRNKGIVVKVADGATFVLSGTLKSKDANNKALTKVGAGEMKITAAQTENSGAYTINGGTLTFVTKNAITLSNTISGTGKVKKSGAETLTLTGTVSAPVEVAAGTLDLGTNRPTIVGIATEATLKLKATDAELVNNAITLSTTMPTAPAKERFTVVKPDGTTVTLTAEPTVTDGTLTVPLPQTGRLITATGNWSDESVSGERVVYVRGSESAESAITVTLDADLSTYTHIGVIGHVKFVTTTTQPTLPPTIVLERGSVLTATASFSGTYTIPSGATVVLDGTTAITSASALTVNGALKTQGTVTLSGANAVSAGGSLTVETGTLTLTAGDQSLAGTINIAADATLVNVTGDALAYNGSPVVNVRGTLDMGSTRWTVGGNNVFNVYAGATIQGVGDSDGALDFYNEVTHTLNVPNEGDASQPVTISATLRLRGANDLLKFNIALANAKVNLTGNVRDAGKLEKAGAGSSRLILSGANKTYAGATTVTVGYLDLVGGCTLATSGVTVASGAAVTFQADESTTETTYTTPFALTGRMDKEGAHSVILSGAITGAGAVNVKNGGLTLDASAATAESPTAVANPITVGLDSGTSGTLTAKGFLSLSNTSNTVKATGTLNIASGTTVLTTVNNAGGIKGKLAIASGATLKCGIDDAPDYNGSPSFEIAGTLEITGTARWSIPSEATITLHSGALLKGIGPASGSNYAFDFFGGAAITADGDATIEANVGSHISNKTLTITQSAGTTTISGEVRNSLGLSVAGSGTVVYAPAESVTATSSPLSVSSGATLQLSPGSAFALNGAVSGAGKLVLGNGSAATSFTSTKAYPDATQSLTVQVKSPSTLTLNPGAGNFAFPNAVAFDVASGAELILASGMSFFGVSGDGSCSVTGDYVFGVSASDFQNGAKVLNVATLTVGTDTNPEVTLSVRPFGAIAIAPTTLKVNENAVIARDSNTSATASASLSLGATATVTGAGAIELPVAFTEGATLDTVTAAPLLLKGKVTGLIKVQLDTAKAVLTTTSDAEFDRNTQLAFANDETSQEFATGGYRFAETVYNDFTTFTVVPPLALPGSLPEAVSGNEAAQDAIYDAVAAWKGAGYNITSVTAVTAESTGGVVGNVEALALFENLYVLATPVGDPLEGDTYAGTVTVYYDFGISEMRVKSASLVDAEEAQLYVLLCAKVATTQNTTTANYASGTIVSLYRGTEALSAVEPNDAQLTALGITPAAGEKWFAVPMAELNSGTNAFKVKASQTTPAAN